MEANKMDNGNTSGIILGILNNRNFKIIMKSKSLPANSEINSQTTCKTNMKNRITNTVANVMRKDFNKYLSSIFTRN
jgi:hypothetical protein